MILLLCLQSHCLLFYIMDNSGLFLVCFLFVLFLLHKLNFVSVVFDFNASLSNVAPISPISLSFNLIGMKVSVLSMNGVCVVFFFEVTP